MPTLYKYLHAGDCGGVPLALRVLKEMRLLASDPCSFNDPFEVRPCFDQECHDHGARTQEAFHQGVAGIEHSLLGNRSMAGIPTEHASAFGEHFNKRFRDSISDRFRVLCLSRNRKSVLMWGHYTGSHSGVVIGIDTETPAFRHGLQNNGFPVQYSPDRSKTRLPLAFYQSPTVEEYDLHGNIVNDPEQPVVSNAGLIIPFKEYRRQLGQAEITALTTKAQDWHYEHEVRFIYDLKQHSSQLVLDNKRHFVAIPPGALREIIVGFRASVSLAENVVDLLRQGRIGQPALFYSECHPYLYEVNSHPTDAKYFLDYFRHILPTISV
jgi:hypothetical protein